MNIQILTILEPPYPSAQNDYKHKLAECWGSLAKNLSKLRMYSKLGICFCIFCFAG